MQTEIVSLSAIALPDADVLHAVRLDDPDEDDLARILEMSAEICAVARPRFLLGSASVSARGDDWVELDGVRFRSPALVAAFQDVSTVYPYLATCGAEAYDWANRLSDELEQYWANALQYLLLLEAIRGLDARAARLPNGLRRIIPGTLPDWTLYGQRDLFRLFGEDTLGVVLHESCLMTPENTVSGCFY